jgi:3-hydroxyisobutyrate dehydrogenase-like beta-hydroxyacid dehydrogenase
MEVGEQAPVPTVAIVSAGAMGSALGARLRDGGARVVTPLAGRSARTRSLAETAGLEPLATLDEVLAVADVALLVVPPGSALAVAAEVADAGRRMVGVPLVADLNAVSPATMEAIARRLGAAGVELVDGSISGPPPTRPGTTRVYLSGARASEIAALPFDGVDRRVVGDRVGLASAVKMCTASVYKGRVAILAQALRVAHAHGVVEHVLDDLVETGLADPERTGETLARASSKAWRYVAEMREIAATQAGAGLTSALFEALAEVYVELAAHSSAAAPEEVEAGISLETVLRDLEPAGGERASGRG